MATHTRLARWLWLVLLIAPLGLARSSATAAVATPVLKWAYGTCQAAPHFCENGWYASPAVADLDGDSKPEVIWGNESLFALNGEDGSTQWQANSGARIWPGIVVTDLTGDGSQEIVVGRNGSQQLTVYTSAGVPVWTRSPFSGEVRALAVEDLEQDGVREIVVGRASSGGTRQVSVYGPDGSVRQGWPARRDGEAGFGAGIYHQNISVADMDGDGNKEIFAPTDTHYITALDRGGNQLPVSGVYSPRAVWSRVGVHVDQAADLRGFAECGVEHRPNFADTSPVVADLDGDGTRELVVVGSVYNCEGDYPEANLYHLPWILKLDRTRWSGSGFDWTSIPAPEPNSGPLASFNNFSVIENVEAGTVVADLDSDGLQEILYPSYDGRMHAYWLDKAEHGDWPFKVPGSGLRYASEPAVVDLDADGSAEVIFASWPQKGAGLVGQLHILDAQGRQLAALDLPAPGSGATWNGGLGAPTVANIDGDADLELVLGTATSGVVAYDLPGSAGARCIWCTGRGNYQRTGVALPAPDYTLRAAPPAQAIQPGSTAVYRIILGSQSGFNGAVGLSAGSASPGLDVQLASASGAPPAEVALTVTDTDSGRPALPGSWHTVRVEADGAQRDRAVEVQLLIGGTRVYLPLARR